MGEELKKDEIKSPQPYEDSLVELYELIRNNFRGYRNFQSKVFLQKDFEYFLYYGDRLLRESASIEEDRREQFRPVDTSPEGRAEFMERRYQVILSNLLLGVGFEYLLKAIFLKNGYAINRIKKEFREEGDNEFVKLHPISDYESKLDPSETVTFDYLKNNLSQIIDFSKFDEEVELQNEKIYKEKINQFYKELPQMSSMGCMGYIQSVRNTFGHIPKIKNTPVGFHKQIDEFLDFVYQQAFDFDFGEEPTFEFITEKEEFRAGP